MRSIRYGVFALFLLTLTACGGGGGSGGGGPDGVNPGGGGGNTSPPEGSVATFKVGVTVTGLLGVLKIQLNGDEQITIGQDGAAQFKATLTNGASYNIAVATQPEGQECIVSNASGSINNADQVVAIGCAYSPRPAISFVWPQPLVVGQEAKISGSNLDQADVTVEDGSRAAFCGAAKSGRSLFAGTEKQ